jgi:RHS repeat-associated protein
VVNTQTHFHLDPAATPLLATTAAGAVAWKENHRPYGDKLNYQAAAASNTIGFAGKPFDNATGLSYMGARYYNPILGRFTGIDPVGFTEANLHSHNRYTYANNNPFKFVDPDGRSPVAIAFIGAIGISLAAQDAYNGYQSGGWTGVANSLATTAAFTVAFGIVGNATVAGVQAAKSALTVSKSVAVEAAPVSINAAQQQNIGRFVGKHAADVKDSLTIQGLPNGSVAAQITVPGKVPGSKAVYEKQVTIEGTTYQSTKTTYDPKGDIVHSKDKAPQISEMINSAVKE